MLSSLGFIFVIVVAMSEPNANLDGGIGDEQREDTAVVVPRDTCSNSEGSQDPSMALQVRAPYARMLVTGCKTWELRGHHTTRRGRILIAESNSHLVIGEVTLASCIPVAQRDGDHLRPWGDAENFVHHASNVEKHRVTDVSKALKYAKVWAWVMQSPVAYDNPWFYEPKKGAVAWLNLKPMASPDEETKQIMEMGG